MLLPSDSGLLFMEIEKPKEENRYHCVSIFVKGRGALSNQRRCPVAFGEVRQWTQGNR